MKAMLDSDTLQGEENISWAAYHASLQPQTSESNVALTSLLPLFHDEAKSVAMIRHAMDVVKTAVDILNPAHCHHGSTTVCSCQTNPKARDSR
jgi:NAD-dependent SIR2 family protein deacetylase